MAQLIRYFALGADGKPDLNDTLVEIRAKAPLPAVKRILRKLSDELRVG